MEASIVNERYSMQLAPSKHPEKESKQFAVLGLACGVVGLFLWFVAIAGLAFSVRGLILSRRIHNQRNLKMSIIGLALSLTSLVYYLS